MPSPPLSPKNVCILYYFQHPPPQNLQYGTHGALKPPKRVWGKSRNVTDNSPTRLGALRAALSYPKHDGVSWVWLTIVILVKVKCTFTRRTPHTDIFGGQTRSINHSREGTDIDQFPQGMISDHETGN